MTVSRVRFIAFYRCTEFYSSGISEVIKRSLVGDRARSKTSEIRMGRATTLRDRGGGEAKIKFVKNYLGRVPRRGKEA